MLRSDNVTTKMPQPTEISDAFCYVCKIHTTQYNTAPQTGVMVLNNTMRHYTAHITVNSKLSIPHDFRILKPFLPLQGLLF